jgi:hypothetical protein
LRTYPTVKHFVCYFHVVENCKDHVKFHPKAVQESIMTYIHYYHSFYSENEFLVWLKETITKWHNEDPGSAEYFIDQWNTEDSFNTWKILCTASAVATTNNSLESSNKTIKKNFTLGICHSLPALFDIVIEKLLFNFH